VPCFGELRILFGPHVGEPDRMPPQQPGQRTRTPSQPTAFGMQAACQTARLPGRVASGGQKSGKNTRPTRRSASRASTTSRPRRRSATRPAAANRSRGVERFAPAARSRWSDSLHQDQSERFHSPRRVCRAPRLPLAAGPVVRARGASAAGQRPGQAGYPTATLTTIFTTGSGSAQAQHGAWASLGNRIMNWPTDNVTGTTSTSAAKSPASCFSS